jgi:hypothetical protein
MKQFHRQQLLYLLVVSQSSIDLLDVFNKLFSSAVKENSVD